MDCMEFCIYAIVSMFILVITNNIISLHSFNDSNITRHYHNHNYYSPNQYNKYESMYDEIINNRFRYRHRPNSYRCKWCNQKHHFKLDDYDYDYDYEF